MLGYKSVLSIAKKSLENLVSTAFFANREEDVMATTNGESHVAHRYTQCSMCKWYAGAHNPICPELTPKGSPERERYDKGYKIGRVDNAGTRRPSDPDEVLGYDMGQIAL